MNMNMTEKHDEDNELTLRQVAERCCKKIDVGAAVLPKPLFIRDWDEIEDANEEELESIGHATVDTVDVDSSNNSMTRYARVLSNEFNSVVIEHHLKWAPLCHSLPGPLEDGKHSTRHGRYDFYHVDLMVDWALHHDMKVKGHVLVWHVTTPPFVEEMNPDQVREELKRHIFTTVGHFRGRIHTWDVVNEALAPDGSLADTVFLRKLGPGYIEEAFRWAHEADPNAFLILNDNKVEGVGAGSPNGVKAEAFYQLLRDLKKRGVPVHGAGIQAHFNAAGVGERQRCPTPRQVKEQIHRLGKLGIKVNISEMDVRVSKLPLNVQQLAQKQIYHDIIAAALTEPAFDGIWLWGFTDRHTWVTNFYHNDTPLILDEEYYKKESYDGLHDALSTLTAGGIVGGNVLMDSDVDQNGNPWGHLWMPKEESNLTKVDIDKKGDSRPDWLQS